MVLHWFTSQIPQRKKVSQLATDWVSNSTHSTLFMQMSTSETQGNIALPNIMLQFCVGKVSFPQGFAIQILTILTSSTCWDELLSKPVLVLLFPYE